MNTKRALFWATLGVGLVTPLAASAQSGQPWLQDRRYGEGIGLRLGNIEFHPGIAAQAGYDSNYFQASGDTGVIDGLAVNEPTVQMARFRVTPSLSLKTVGPRRNADGEQAAAPKVNFSGEASLGYNKLIALNDGASDEGTGDFFTGNAGVAVDVLPDSPWGVDFNANYMRMVQPSNEASSPPAFNRSVVRGGLGVEWRPGGGLFSWRAGYGATYTFFENDDFSPLDNWYHSVTMSGRWKFLPRTALLYEGEIGFIDYPDPDATQAEATPISSQLGVSGMLSKKLALLTLAGWQGSFYDPKPGEDEAEDFDGPIGQVQLTWYPMANPTVSEGSAPVGLSSVAVGYTRASENAYLGNYVLRNRFYANLDYFLGGVVLFSLQGGWSMLSRPRALFPVDPDDADADPEIQAEAFTEHRADAQVFAEYRFSDVIGVNTTFIYNGALTEKVIQVRPDGPGRESGDNLRFDRFEAWLGVRGFM